VSIWFKLFKVKGLLTYGWHHGEFFHLMMLP